MAAQGVLHWMQVCVILQLCVVLQLCLSEVLPAAPETSRNYYDTLNVEPTATDSQIKKNFRKLAIKYHPDKNKSAEAEKTFREIAEAYKVLSNKETRRVYDSMGHEAFLKDDSPTDPEDEYEANFHFHFADIFHDFDDSPFMEEPDFHWIVHHDVEDGGIFHEHYGFEEPAFTFIFADGGEDEEDYHY